MSEKNVLIAAKIDYLVDYAKKQFKDYKGLHLNSKDWEAFINIGTAQFYSFIVNGVIKFYTTTSISGKRYDQIFKFTQFKLIEPVILLLFLTGQDIEKIIDYTAKFLSLTEVKLFCPCKAFQFYGPHYNLTKIKSAFGPGEIRPPDIRDPKRNNLVCKHLWIVLRMYEKYIREFAKGMIPYYKRQFGINSPTGVQRLKKNLGMKGFKKIVQQAILNLHKINDTELLSLFNTLTENRLKDLLTTNIEIPSIPKEELNKTPEQIKEEAEKELEEEEKAELIDPEEEKKEEKVEEKEKEEEKSEVINVNDLKEILKKEKEKESSEKSTETENPEAKDYKELMTSKRIIINDYIIDHLKKNKKSKIKKHEDVILPEWKGFVKKHEKIISEDTN